MMRLLLLLLLATLLFAKGAAAHSFDAATLTLTEVSDGTFAIDWRTTAKTLEDDRLLSYRLRPAPHPRAGRPRIDHAPSDSWFCG